MFRVIEKYRITQGRLQSDSTYGNNGAFNIEDKFFCVASDGDNWEHVSVSLMKEKRCPTWEEMCYIKSLFWSEDDCVIQYHPSKENYVNVHNYCLHLWKPISGSIPTPPSYMIG
jgi:hypothetical protein